MRYLLCLWLKRRTVLSRALLDLRRLRESALAEPVTSRLVHGGRLGGRTAQRVGGVIAGSGVVGRGSRLAKALKAERHTTPRAISYGDYSVNPRDADTYGQHAALPRAISHETAA